MDIPGRKVLLGKMQAGNSTGSRLSDFAQLLGVARLQKQNKFPPDIITGGTL